MHWLLVIGGVEDDTDVQIIGAFSSDAKESKKPTLSKKLLPTSIFSKIFKSKFHQSKIKGGEKEKVSTIQKDEIRWIM